MLLIQVFCANCSWNVLPIDSHIVCSPTSHRYLPLLRYHLIRGNIPDYLIKISPSLALSLPLILHFSPLHVQHLKYYIFMYWFTV